MNNNKLSIWLSKLSFLLYGVLFFVLSSFAQEEDVSQSVRFQHVYDIPVIESERPLIAGVKIELFLIQHIPEYDDFEYTLTGGFRGIGATGRVKPDPNDPETRFFWGKKRNLPFYKRQWRIAIGVYQSHRDALVAASRYYSDWSVIINTDPMEKENPGFVSWSGKDFAIDSWSGTDFVIDNVFACFSASNSMNTVEIITALKQGLFDGAEWVIKGDKPVSPQIQGEDFPSEFSFWVDQMAKTQLTIVEPNERKIFQRIQPRNKRGYKKKYNPALFLGGLKEIPIYSMPTIKWQQSGVVEITHSGGPLTFDLEAVAVNDLCVVSDVWKKEIHISIPEE